MVARHGERKRQTREEREEQSREADSQRPGLQEESIPVMDGRVDVRNVYI